ncbi:response regulator [Candidatus Paracaedibacter symbiosus]|uniref:response regulator n=1 Tax=Candidatus Paracaedibacter symbiosus TaxID=244582 RepID=UPI0005095E40|nr:response regulator [Candidatus Paracaedibacter symbiosus]
MKSLLCCYYPTKVIFVDDSTLLLESLVPILDENVASYDYFDSPEAALELINNSESSFSIQDRKIDEIYKTIYNPRRYEEISTVIVDYEMPSMKGLEFCENLQNPYIRKILYTGAADESLAITAFNKGIIDGYIPKNHPDPSAAINDFVKESQLKYFRSLTDVSVEAILREYSAENPGDTAFYDPAFIDYFDELVKKHNFCEYYLNEIFGSFVFLSPKGKPSALFTYPEEIFERMQLEFQGILEDKMTSTKQISSSLIKDLEEKRKMVCLPFCGGEMHPEPEKWEKYAYPVQEVKGNQTYYVAYVPDADYVTHSEVLSFEKYSRSR